jgi:hypothetical protein
MNARVGPVFAKLKQTRGQKDRSPMPRSPACRASRHDIIWLRLAAHKTFVAPPVPVPGLCEAGPISGLYPVAKTTGTSGRSALIRAQASGPSILGSTTSSSRSMRSPCSWNLWIACSPSHAKIAS